MNSERPADLVTLTELLQGGRDADRDQGAALHCPAHLLDGWLVHTAALEAGLGTWLFPGQALLIKSDPGGFGELSFAHGVPQQTHLSMATVVQDNRIRRALLEARGIPVPKGASFSIGKGVAGALKFADRIGYPVVVKPVIGESTIETTTHLRDRKGLLEAIRYFYTAPNYRERSVSASYAFTALHTPKDEGSDRARPSYRILVEKQVSGKYLRLLVLNGKLVSAISAPQGPWRLGENGRDVLADVHPSVEQFALDVWQIFRGLPVLVLDVVIDGDYSRSIHHQNYAVVEVSERPWLHVQDYFSRDAARSIARAILQVSAEQLGVSVPPSNCRTIAADVHWQGISSMSSFIDQVERISHMLGVDASIQVADAIGGTASGRITGDALVVALLNELTVAGKFPGERIMAVETTPSHR